MTTVVRSFLLVAFLLLAGTFLLGLPQTDASPDVYALRARMARSNSVASLKRVHSTARTHDKLTELVFYARWMILSPASSSAARGLLEVVPSNEAEQGQLMQIMDLPEGAISQDEDMTALAKIHDRWADLMARAVLLAPSSMKNYVNYLPLAPSNIHSDFTGNAERVCRKLPREFRAAFVTLSEKDQAYVRKWVFDPDHCGAIFRSEAD